MSTSVGIEFVAETRNDFVEVMEMMDKRLNDKGKNWRHVFKVSLPSDANDQH